MRSDGRDPDGENEDGGGKLTGGDGRGSGGCTNSGNELDTKLATILDAGCDKRLFKTPGEAARLFTSARSVNVENGCMTVSSGESLAVRNMALSKGCESASPDDCVGCDCVTGCVLEAGIGDILLNDAGTAMGDARTDP